MSPPFLLNGSIMFSGTKCLRVRYVAGNWASILLKDTNFGVLNVDLHSELLSFSQSTCFIPPFKTQLIFFFLSEFVFGLSLIFLFFFLLQTLTLDFDAQRSVPELTDPPAPATHTHTPQFIRLCTHHRVIMTNRVGGGVFAND